MIQTLCHIEARFYIDKPAYAFDIKPQCQFCGSSLIEPVVNGPGIIKQALDALTPEVIMVTQITKPKGNSSEVQDNS